MCFLCPNLPFKTFELSAMFNILSDGKVRVRKNIILRKLIIDTNVWPHCLIIELDITAIRSIIIVNIWTK